MKKLYKNVVSYDQAQDIIKSIKKHNNIKINDKSHWLVDKVLELIKNDFNVNISPQSYYRVEQKSNGHKWHIDTGTSKHMMWCKVGISILLQDGTSGGETFYADNEKETNKTKSKRELYDLVAHTSDEWHMVTPHTGNRIVFLMFI